MGERFQSVVGCTLPVFGEGRVRPRTFKNTPPIMKEVVGGGGEEGDAAGCCAAADTENLVLVHNFTSKVLRSELVFGLTPFR